MLEIYEFSPTGQFLVLMLDKYRMFCVECLDNGLHKCHILSKDILGIYSSLEIIENPSSLATYEELENQRENLATGPKY